MFISTCALFQYNYLLLLNVKPEHLEKKLVQISIQLLVTIKHIMRTTCVCRSSISIQLLVTIKRYFFNVCPPAYLISIQLLVTIKLPSLSFVNSSNIFQYNYLLLLNCSGTLKEIKTMCISIQLLVTIKPTKFQHFKFCPIHQYIEI